MSLAIGCWQVFGLTSAPALAGFLPSTASRSRGTSALREDRSRLPLRGSPGVSPGSLLALGRKPKAPTPPLHMGVLPAGQQDVGGAFEQGSPLRSVRAIRSPDNDDRPARCSAQPAPALGCQECAPSNDGGDCVADSGVGGQCEGVGTCDATSCAGCCAGNLCAVGTQSVGCGQRGVPCQDCSADGGLCLDLLGAPDGEHRVCGYDCPNTAPPPTCTVWCTSATDCIPAGDVTQLQLLASFRGRRPRYPSE